MDVDGTCHHLLIPDRDVTSCTCCRRHRLLVFFKGGGNLGFGLEAISRKSSAFRMQSCLRQCSNYATLSVQQLWGKNTNSQGTQTSIPFQGHWDIGHPALRSTDNKVNFVDLQSPYPHYTFRYTLQWPALLSVSHPNEIKINAGACASPQSLPLSTSG
ncbi:hypothetical protein CEXT_406491 [Caerostris extrusa]|uniref:Uncharacterized protein n=1 Tax=Caerostris extrusa TaxID=172846 RepID=A0AAV4MUZ5_CAEEX|nr:hypothetical protein CEXT_406491 [Caerostris extrusa]